MERLTFVDEDGLVLFDSPAGFPEDIGFTIRELAENEEWEALDNIAQGLANCEQRLKYYEDLEEQGKLLKLPCAVGDIIYEVSYENREFLIKEHTVKEFVYRKYRFPRIEIYCENENGFLVCNSIGKLDEFLFLTRQEAEAALKKL